MDVAPRPRSRAAAGLSPITPDQIVDVALRLTAAHGVRGWSIHTAAELDAGVALVHHHVGTWQDVVLGVARRVAALDPLPPADLPCRDWFGELLSALGRVALRQPGIARELVVAGPAVDSRRITEAGFGDEPAVAVRDRRGGSPAPSAGRGGPDLRLTWCVRAGEWGQPSPVGLFG